MDIKSTTAWASLGIALTALVLSQFPPIPSYFASPSLELTAYNSLHVRHYLGDLVLVPYLQVNNSGTAPGKISKIELEIAKQDKPSVRKSLLAQSYYLKPDTVSLNQTPTSLPLGQVAVPPGETWETFVDFFETPNEARRVRTANIQHQVAEQIQTALAVEQRPANSPVEISSELLDEIKTLSNAGLSWFEIGEYRLVLKLFGEHPHHPVAQQCYALTVFEGNLSQLSVITEEYRFGAGITFPLRNTSGFVGNLSERNTC